MSDRPRLVDVGAIPEALKGADNYTSHVRAVMRFAPEDQRVIPDAVRTRIAQVFGEASEDVMQPLREISAFLGETFVFDDLSYEARDGIRLALEAENPEAYAWYDKHMMRLNRIGGVVGVARNLSDIVDPMMKRVLERPPLRDQLDGVSGAIHYRWKRLESALEGWTVEEDWAVKRDMIANHVAPLLQDVFDISVLTLNGFELVGTLPDGAVSRSMREIVDVRNATLAGSRRMRERGGREDD